jgi:hypothetical protein
MEENLAHLIQYNDDDTVNMPFGRAAEWYISNHPLLKKYSFEMSESKKNSRLDQSRYD